MSTVRANNYYDASGGSNAQLYGVASPPNSMGFRNRILNGDCRIDQRNAGASVTGNNDVFPVDRFQFEASQNSKMTGQQNAGAVTPPAGFRNYLGVTSSSAYSVGAGERFNLRQIVEGYNIADLGWGTANAQTVTLSFWVRSSLTGTFGGALSNSAANRSYPYSYTISAANTWEQKVITIPGDTSGTWLTDNGRGVQVKFGLGVGTTYSGPANAWAATDYVSATGATSVVATNGATFYITGVQLEAGTVASPFERRDYGRELMMCQRYYESSFPIGTAPAQNAGKFNHAIFAANSDGGSLEGVINFFVPKRAAPSTVTYYNPSAANANFSNGGTVNQISADALGIDVYTTTTTGARTFVNWSASSEL